jgi:uncharacterized metal-binding protein
MPGYKGHLVGGVITFGIVFACMYTSQVTTATALEWLGFTLAGSLFPDIDIKSKGQKYFYWIFLALFLWLIYQKMHRLLAATSVVAIAPMLARHRGLFHKTWFVVGAPFLVCAVVGIYVPLVAKPLFCATIFFVAGALSHLFLDVGPRRMFKW